MWLRLKLIVYRALGLNTYPIVLRMMVKEISQKPELYTDSVLPQGQKLEVEKIPEGML